MTKIYGAYLRAAALVTGLGMASPVVAGDVASEFGLGNVQGFNDETAATSYCHGDGVVWADRRTGFYYPKFAPEYGVGQTGEPLPHVFNQDRESLTVAHIATSPNHTLYGT